MVDGATDDGTGEDDQPWDKHCRAALPKIDVMVPASTAWFQTRPQHRFAMALEIIDDGVEVAAGVPACARVGRLRR